MFIFGELFKSLAFLINGVCQLLYWLIFARIIISWFPVDPYHQIVQFLNQVTEPILAPFRRIPLQIGMLDMTPLVAFIALHFVNTVLVRILLTAAYQFGAA
ncbi:MAG TPA: YggT family protein [Verrucomicrobiae bacterium]|jgi:YggT family protein|nr:YggT family protein [Verrucomicrobiae bacterium]